MAKRNEVSYYTEIQEFIGKQIKSNFRALKKKDLDIYWGIGELKTNLNRIILEHPQRCECMTEFAQTVPPLNLDIFAIITDGLSFKLLILEVKMMQAAGLKEWSQLVGYCLVSGCKYGLLVNINNGASPRLKHILSTEKHLSYIKTIVKDIPVNHFLGFMQWNGITKDFEYSNLGYIRSLSSLCECLANDFDN